MGFWEKIKRLMFNYNEEGEEVETNQAEETAEPEAGSRIRPFRNVKETEQAPRQTSTGMNVVLAKPESISKHGREVADQIRSGCTIILNMEGTTPDNCRRLLDFFSGAAYTNDATLKRTSNSTYMITPNSNNIDIMGNLIIDEMDGSEIYIDV